MSRTSACSACLVALLYVHHYVRHPLPPLPPARVPSPSSAMYRWRAMCFAFGANHRLYTRKLAARPSIWCVCTAALWCLAARSSVVVFCSRSRGCVQQGLRGRRGDVVITSTRVPAPAPALPVVTLCVLLVGAGQPTNLTLCDGCRAVPRSLNASAGTSICGKRLSGSSRMFKRQTWLPSQWISASSSNPPLT